jgi:hypothetical protein
MRRILKDTTKLWTKGYPYFFNNLLITKNGLVVEQNIAGILA